MLTISKSLHGIKTLENLKHAFAGESQANRRYLYFLWCVRHKKPAFAHLSLRKGNQEKQNDIENYYHMVYIIYPCLRKTSFKSL